MSSNTPSSVPPLDGSAQTASNTQSAARKFSLPLLTCVVIASMIGGGAFNLPQNMSRHAALLAVIIAWMITFVGMFLLASAFRLLADHRPDLKAGIYSYAKEGFGTLAGFEMAWGYWLAATFGNIALSVLSIKTLSYFFPIFANSDGWPLIVGSSALIWLLHFIMLSGVKRVAVLNAIASGVNLIALSIVLCIMAVKVDWSQFKLNFWGTELGLGRLVTQIKSTMMVTLWVFMGIESAVVVSNRAADSKQVGRATCIALAVCTVLYFLLSVLPFGLLPQSQLAQLPAPSAAYVLEALVGHWGATLVVVSLLISIGSCWLAWTILIAEMPYEAAKGGVFPKFFMSQNRRQAPAASLWVSSTAMQVGLLIVWFVQDAWIWLISIAGVMILPTYLTSTAYLWRSASQADSPFKNVGKNGRLALWTGALGAIYALWLLWAAGPQFLLISAIMFTLGLPVYWWARRENAAGQAIFTRRETIAAVILIVVAICALRLFAIGSVKIS